MGAEPDDGRSWWRARWVHYRQLGELSLLTCTLRLAYASLPSQANPELLNSRAALDAVNAARFTLSNQRESVCRSHCSVVVLRCYLVQFLPPTLRPRGNLPIPSTPTSTFRRARGEPSLGDRCLTSTEALPSSFSVRIFDVDVCKTLTLMSTLVYERSDEKVQEASQLAVQLQDPSLSSAQQTSVINRANALLEISEQRIREQVHRSLVIRSEQC